MVAAAPQVAKHKSKEEEKTQKKEAVKAVKNAPAKVEAKPAKKNKKGNRLFTQKDVENLKVIYHLVKERGFTLAGAKKKLSENRTDVAQNSEVVEKLREIRGFLVELRDSL